MKNTIRYLIVSCFLVVPVLADEFLDQPFTKENYDAFTEKHGLTDERVTLLIGFVIKRGFEAMAKGMESPELVKYVYKDGWTLRDALDQARKDKAAQDAETAKKKEEEKLKREALLRQRLKELKEVASIRILGEKIESQGDDQMQVFTIEIVNNSSKEIKGIKGRFLVKDVFDKIFVQLPIRVTSPIAPGQTYTYERKRPFDPADSLTYRLQEKLHDEMASLDFMWNPKAVVYSDGTLVELLDSK